MVPLCRVTCKAHPEICDPGTHLANDGKYLLPVCKPKSVKEINQMMHLQLEMPYMQFCQS